MVAVGTLTIPAGSKTSNASVTITAQDDDDDDDEYVRVSGEASVSGGAALPKADQPAAVYLVIADDDESPSQVQKLSVALTDPDADPVAPNYTVTWEAPVGRHRGRATHYAKL